MGQFAQGLSTDGIAPETGSRKLRPSRKMHGFFVAFALIFAAIVLTAFSRTYFIPVARGAFSRSLAVHVHGAFFFAWTAVLVLQTILAATKRMRIHRNVGSIAVWLVPVMLIMGTLVAARDTVNDFRAGDGDAALSFFYGELADLAMFGLLAGAAMLVRNQPDYHKRWVILGSLGLIGAAIGRIPEISAFGIYIFVGLITSVLAYDIASGRKLHPATLIGTAVLLSLSLSQERIGSTTIWLKIARQLLEV